MEWKVVFKIIVEMTLFVKLMHTLGAIISGSPSLWGPSAGVKQLPLSGLVSRPQGPPQLADKQTASSDEEAHL